MTRPNAALDPMRRLAKMLRDFIEEPDPGRLSLADAKALPAVIEALGFALTDWLETTYIVEQGASYNASRQVEDRAELAAAARALGRAGRSARVPR